MLCVKMLKFTYVNMSDMPCVLGVCVCAVRCSGGD